MPVSPAKSVLIVDDNTFVRYVLRSLLESRTDVRVVGEAANGSQAVDRAKLLKPDLILMDLAMPEMNGFEASSVIKGVLPATKIILFTLFVEALGEMLAKSAGIDVIIPKDEGIAGLVRALNRMIA